jgi:hypothetical protein
MTETKGSVGKLRPGWRRNIGKLLLAFGGILVGLTIAELALRVSGFRYFNGYIVDQDVGFTLRPGAEGWWEREHLTYIKINSHGFRDREHSFVKPPDTLRIAVLGDSYVEALQVPLEKTFWSVMEQKLQGCSQSAASKVEVLSFGVSGFSTASELITLRKRVWQYSPDVIVLLVTTGNDIRDNSPKLTPFTNKPLPYFVSTNGKLVFEDSLLAARNRSLVFRLQQSFPGRSLNWLRSHLRLLGLIDWAREAYQSSIQERERQNQPGTIAKSNDEPGVASQVFREPGDPDWNDAWQVTEGLFVQMRDEVKAHGAKFLVVTGSTGIQVNPDQDTRKTYMNHLGVRDLFYPDQRIKSLGEREGFRVMNLAPPLEEYATRNQVFLHGPVNAKGRGHWNELGHRLAGELIAGELCKVLLEGA